MRLCDQARSRRLQTRILRATFMIKKNASQLPVVVKTPAHCDFTRYLSSLGHVDTDELTFDIPSKKIVNTVISRDICQAVPDGLAFFFTVKLHYL